MTGDRQFWARYPGESTDEDRAALQRPGFKLYVDGYAVSAAWDGDGPPPGFTTYQVVRVAADDPEDARRRLVEALSREPDGLLIDEGKSSS